MCGCFKLDISIFEFWDVDMIQVEMHNLYGVVVICCLVDILKRLIYYVGTFESLTFCVWNLQCWMLSVLIVYNFEHLNCELLKFNMCCLCKRWPFNKCVYVLVVLICVFIVACFICLYMFLCVCINSWIVETWIAHTYVYIDNFGILVLWTVELYNIFFLFW